MINLVKRARELVSSNVDALIDKASDPAKMLGLLRTEVEENLVALQGDLSKAVREHDRLGALAKTTAKQAEEWTAKAKTASDHARDDLARAALLARESGRKQAAELTEAAKGAKANVAEIKSAITELEAKRQDVAARLRDALPAGKPSNSSSGAAKSAAKDSKTDRRMDRIDALERRTDFAAPSSDSPKSDADIEAEIAALGEQSAIDAELAAMKAPAKKTPRKKTK